MTVKKFSPDWISPPGDTIAAILNERQLTVSQFADQIRCNRQDAEDLLAGRLDVSADLAAKLAATLGSTAEFWMRREARYRQDLDRFRQEATNIRNRSWLDEIPLKDMKDWGWITPSQNPSVNVLECLRFFGVPSVQAWRDAYSDVLHINAFRTSKTFPSSPAAVAAWIREGEIRAASIVCKEWSPDRFRKELTDIRTLTREPSPKVFVPQLIQRCAACGVAVVVLRAPDKCRASGATRFLSPTRPLLMLSFRYRSDDHFWFSFFHEAAHLLLHSDRLIFLEGDDRISTSEEEEANAFAADTLVPKVFRAEMMSLPPHTRPVMRFARKIGIARGIVVGQMQNRGVLGQDRLNKLKQRYPRTETDQFV